MTGGRLFWTIHISRCTSFQVGFIHVLLLHIHSWINWKTFQGWQIFRCFLREQIGDKATQLGDSCCVHKPLQLRNVPHKSWMTCQFLGWNKLIHPKVCANILGTEQVCDIFQRAKKKSLQQPSWLFGGCSPLIVCWFHPFFVEFYRKPLISIGTLILLMDKMIIPLFIGF